MNHHSPTAPANACPVSLPLPFNVPRKSWPGFIEHAADALAGECIFDSETLAPTLRVIAAAMRAEVAA